LILDEDIKFVKLQNLDLGGNNIRSLPEQMRKLIYLKDLSLQFTGLTHLPKSLISLYRLQSVYLHEGYLDQESVEVIKKLKDKGVRIFHESYLEMTLESLPVSNETLEKLELLDYISDNDKFLNSEELDIFNKIAARVNKDSLNDTIGNFPSLSNDSVYDENDYLLQGEFETASNIEIFEILTQLKHKISRHLRSVNL
jgi:Leucine-rich repeat (LRR) protein